MTTPIILHMDIKITPEGVMIGQCKEFPAVIVQAETKEKLIQEMKDGVMGLYEVFPKEFAAMATQYAMGKVKKDIPKPPLIKKDVELISIQLAAIN
jgi:predicted RNase H-like HicB family nuclease